MPIVRARSIPVRALPKEQLLVGERLRVIWTAEGKDYLAVCVVRGDFERGWLLLWQPGIMSAKS
ncbi:MAG: hypothetical protein IPL39_25145 [Opitutaceae bacterium]|nr:hypothetical protein [Opitutaceae bacterium]